MGVNTAHLARLTPVDLDSRHRRCADALTHLEFVRALAGLDASNHALYRGRQCHRIQCATARTALTRGNLTGICADIIDGLEAVRTQYLDVFDGIPSLVAFDERWRAHCTTTHDPALIIDMESALGAWEAQSRHALARIQAAQDTGDYSSYSAYSSGSESSSESSNDEDET